MKLTLITVATEKNGYYNVLMKTAKKHGYEIKTLGFGQSWGGYTTKYKLMKEYLDGITMTDENKEDIIVFLDGYDTFILNNMKLLLERYKSFKKPLVIGAQWNRKKFGKWSQFIIQLFSSGFNTVLNSGSYMGSIWILKEKFDMLCSLFDCNITSQNDQKLLNKARELNPDFFKEHVAIDKEGIIFYNAAYKYSFCYYPFIKNCSWFNDIEMDKKDSKILIRDTNIEPIFLSGPGNVNLESFVEYKYGELYKSIIKREDNQYGFEFYKEYNMEFILYNGGLVIVFVLVIFITYKFIRLFV